MWPDPIVDEVRNVRDEHARECNYGVAAIFADLRRMEREMEGPLVRREPKPAGRPVQGVTPIPLTEMPAVTPLPGNHPS